MVFDLSNSSSFTLDITLKIEDRIMILDDDNRLLSLAPEDLGNCSYFIWTQALKMNESRTKKTAKVFFILLKVFFLFIIINCNIFLIQLCLILFEGTKKSIFGLLTLLQKSI